MIINPNHILLISAYNSLQLSVMRKNYSFTQFTKIKKSNVDSSENKQSSKITVIQNNSLFLSRLQQSSGPSKGFSFGSQQRKSLMNINTISPSSKYNIKGLVQINLNAKKGPTIGLGRQESVQKTTLSYINKNSNPGPANYSSSQQLLKSKASIKIGKKNNETLPVEFLNNKAISNNPGPGAYPVKVVKLKGGKMTTHSIRFQTGKENYRPGPGSYSSTNLDMVSRSSSRVSFKAR